MKSLKTVLTEAFINEAREYINFFAPIKARIGGERPEALAILKWPEDKTSSTDATNIEGDTSYYIKIETFQNSKKEYGTPTDKQIACRKFIKEFFWKEFSSKSNNIDFKTLRKEGFVPFGSGSNSSISYYFTSPDDVNIYLNMPRSARHPDEYGTNENTISEFEKIDSKIEELRKILKTKYKTNISNISA